MKMKKILDCIVLALAALLVYCVFVSSVSGADTITAYKNRDGSYLLYKNGKIAGYVQVLPSNGNIVVKDFYTKQRARDRARNVRRSTPKVQASQPPHMTDKEYDEMLKRWRMSRYGAYKAGGVYWWELMYPSVFHR
jgi:hypothetical protein